MRLTIIITAMAEGGMERFAATLCNTLASQNREVLLCALHESSPDASAGWLDDAVPVRVLHRRARWASVGLVKLCREKPDDPVLALGLEIAVVLSWLKRLKVIRNPILYRESTDIRSHLNSAWTRRMKHLLPRLNGLIVQSRTVEQDLRELNADVPPVCCVGNPCAWLAEPSPGFARRLSDPAAPRLLCAARLERIKGQERLLEAMPGVLSQFPGAHLQLLGSGSREDALREKVRIAGLDAHIHFCGFQSDPRPFYHEADILILPSDYEGFPNVLPEAIACGCRVVCADAPGGIGELMRQTGLDAFLVSLDRFGPELPDKLAEALHASESVWESTRERMAALCAPVAVADTVWEFAAARRPDSQ
ncbi:MAG: glycosyltransferase [Kiritimatiellae bacterium]|jgi:glycosyltransferase involved in cell wall biosynthesis|nr:glycosyltransferase [Kiritimatiellia bacterium]